MPSTNTFYAISIEMNGYLTNGEELPCLRRYSIFKNLVMANGYSMSTSYEWGISLEISLNMVDELAVSERVDEFDDNVFIKGFPTMLIATMIIGNLE